MAFFQCLIIATVASVCWGKAAELPEAKVMALRDCKKEYSVMCFKVDIASYVDKFSKIDDINLFGGLSVVKDENANDTSLVADIARSFPNDPSKRIDEYLIAKIRNYLNSRSIKIKLLDDNATEAARAAFTARKGSGGLGGGGGKKGGYEGLAAAALMMKGTLMAVGLAALAALAGKALMTALLALMLSSIIGLKSMSHGGTKSTTYEIIAKPHYTHSNSASHTMTEEHGHHGYGHSGYGRSSNLVK